MRTGLIVDVYRAADGSDCTLGGVSATAPDFILTGEGVEGPFEVNESEPGTELVFTKGPHDSLRAVPRELIECGAWVMFGGNFCFSSDSRFPSDQPIKIFDRVEIGEARA